MAILFWKAKTALVFSYLVGLFCYDTCATSPMCLRSLGLVPCPDLLDQVPGLYIDTNSAFYLIRTLLST